MALTQVGLGAGAQPVVTLGYASLSPLVAALFLSVRWVSITGAATIVGLAMLLWLSAHSPSVADLLGTGVTNAMTTVLALLFSHNLNQRQRQGQRQTTEAMRRLAGGVANDFSNLLTVVLGNVELLQESSSARELEEIERAALLAKSLTAQLLAFTRQSTVTLELVDLRVVVQKVVAMA